jgi:hypothetical protein
MSDNGSQMIAGEFKDGLENLGILFQRSQPYSPWSNGKIESFWNPLENRLLKMLKKVQGLNLTELNNLTQIWLEEDYHKSHHSELGDSPRQIFIRGKNVFRPSPSFESIRKSFRMTVTRMQKMSDHSLCVDGVRYQIPKEYWHIPELRLRYARWDLSEVDIIGDQDTVIATIYPINKVLNADRNYKNIQLMREKIEDVLPPLLRQQYLNQKEKQNSHQYIPKDQ